MKGNLIKGEWLAILRNRKLLIPVIAILFIPVLYAGMFLWAFWDPYQHLTDLPVVVVNEDSGASFDGKKINLGRDLTEKLKDSADFQFHIVNEKSKALDELKQQKYYLLIEIPSDFSENATTLLEKDPKKLNLVYVPNESYNFLSSQIGGTAIEKIKASVSEKVSETYAQTLFDKVGQISDGMEQASDGAGKIAQGAKKLQDGSKTLSTSLSELAAKSLQFQTGINKANAGSVELATGVNTLSGGLSELGEGHKKLETASVQLLTGETELAAGLTQSKSGLEQVEAKIPSLITGTEQLQTGAQTLASSLQQWQTGAQTASDSAKQINLGVQGLEQQLQPILSQLPPEQQEALRTTLTKLSDGTKSLSAGNAGLATAAGSIAAGGENLSTGLGNLAAGQKMLQSGIGQLTDGSVRLETGANTIVAGQQEFIAGMKMYDEKMAEASSGSKALAQGSVDLSSGVTQLADGTTKIVDGTGKLAAGAEQLVDGNGELTNGSQELATKLSEGAEQTASVQGSNKTYNMMAAPVEVKNEKVNEVPNYGTGFAPYFLSLGLFVGALLLSIVFPLRESVGKPKNAFSWFLSKFAVISVIGIIQALLAVFVMIVGLGIEVQNIPLFIFFAIVTSLTFITLVQMLVTSLGDAGRFVAIIILILQLTTSAGTFPLELIPNFLQHFNAFLPMTYSVKGFKDVISSGDFASMWQNVVILVLYILAFSAGTISYFTMMHKRRFAATTLTE